MLYEEVGKILGWIPYFVLPADCDLELQEFTVKGSQETALQEKMYWNTECYLGSLGLQCIDGYVLISSTFQQD